MLRVTTSTSSSGAKRYFGENLTRSDYYIDGQEIAGLWGGKAAEPLRAGGCGELFRALRQPASFHRPATHPTPKGESPGRVRLDILRTESDFGALRIVSG